MSQPPSEEAPGFSRGEDVTSKNRSPPAEAPDRLRGFLFLEDGTVMEGSGIGAPVIAQGEVVFATGMVGYQEAMTDPSYRGQILLFTYPLIGNYGVPSTSVKDQWGLPLRFESTQIQPRAVIMRSTSVPHHHNSVMSLHTWLSKAGIPGLVGVDTRRLTGILRAKGVQRGVVAVGAELPSLESARDILKRSPRYGEEDLVGQVTPSRPTMLHSGKGGEPLVAILDCGCKTSIMRSLLRRKVDVLRLPAGRELPERWNGRKVDGYVIGNGPGDPEMLRKVVEVIAARPKTKPILGICLGHQLLALSAGADTYKMKFGHRGQNKPVLFGKGGDQGYILSENHGYAVEGKSLRGTGLRTWAVDPDDGTIEGLRDNGGRILCVQGHPEGAPGPREASFVFDDFLVKVRKGR